jgi:hypothetical protein
VKSYNVAKFQKWFFLGKSITRNQQVYYSKTLANVCRLTKKRINVITSLNNQIICWVSFREFIFHIRFVMTGYGSMGLGRHLVRFVIVLLAFFYWGDPGLATQPEEPRTSETNRLQPHHILTQSSKQPDSPDGLSFSDQDDSAYPPPEFLEKNHLTANNSIEATIINPVRSAAIVFVVSENGNRNWGYLVESWWR